MTFDDAVAASTVGAAAFPAVEDIVRLKDDTTWWWLQDHYVQRDKPLGEKILSSDGWHPIQPIKPNRAR